MSYFSGEQKEVNLIQNVLGVACVRPLPKKINGTYFFEGRENYNVAFRIVLVGDGGSFVFTLMVSNSNMQQNKNIFMYHCLTFLPTKSTVSKGGLHACAEYVLGN